MTKWTKYEKILGVLFLLTIPVVRPWIHGDGRGYYAYARAILFQHNMDFERDWYYGYEHHPQISDPSFRAKYLTPTGHFWNHWTIGPAILWAPFLIAARAVMVVLDRVRGTNLADDGFSKPYMIAMALGTMFYGFLALLISFRLARKYVPERPAFLATVGIWLATSFAFYLYFEPSFPHVHSAFLIALFVWFWDHTRGNRAWWQWMALGALTGLLMDTYYPNVFITILPLIESIHGYWIAARERAGEKFARYAGNNLLFGASALLVFSPTLLTKKVLWGSYFQTGYREVWHWTSPAFFKVCFSSHGTFSWTPILIPAVVGLYLLCRTNKMLSYSLLGTLVAFIYFIGCYEGWHAIPSFGHRFFISFTVFFVLGLGALLKELDRQWKGQRLVRSALAAAVGMLIIWNCGLIFQYSTHLFPQEGQVSWSQIAYNQVAVVPGRVMQLVRTSLERKNVSAKQKEYQYKDEPQATPVRVVE